MIIFQIIVEGLFIPLSTWVLLMHEMNLNWLKLSQWNTLRSKLQSKFIADMPNMILVCKLLTRPKRKFYVKGSKKLPDATCKSSKCENWWEVVIQFDKESLEDLTFLLLLVRLDSFLKTCSTSSVMQLFLLPSNPFINKNEENFRQHPLASPLQRSFSFCLGVLGGGYFLSFWKFTTCP